MALGFRSCFPENSSRREVAGRRAQAGVRKSTQTRGHTTASRAVEIAKNDKTKTLDADLSALRPLFSLLPARPALSLPPTQHLPVPPRAASPTTHHSPRSPLSPRSLSPRSPLSPRSLSPRSPVSSRSASSRSPSLRSSPPRSPAASRSPSPRTSRRLLPQPRIPSPAVSNATQA